MAAHARARTHGPQALEIGAPKGRVSHTQSVSRSVGPAKRSDPSWSPAVAVATLIRSLNERARSRASARQKNMADSLWRRRRRRRQKQLARPACRNPWLAGNGPNGKNYEPEICQRGNSPSSDSFAKIGFSAAVSNPTVQCNGTIVLYLYQENGRAIKGFNSSRVRLSIEQIVKLALHAHKHREA